MRRLPIGSRALKHGALWAISAAAFIAMYRYKVGIIPVILACGAAGFAYTLLL